MQTDKKDEKKAQMEWLYIQSSVKNEVVLLGLLMNIELYPFLDRREEDGALIPSLRMKQGEAVSPDKIEEQKKIFLERKSALLKTIGDTNPEVELISEKLVVEYLKDKKMPTDDKAKEDFWKIYLMIEDHYEAGFIPTFLAEETGIYPHYKIVPKPKKTEKPDLSTENASVANEEKVLE